jgi:hypothetical protein
MSVLTTATDQQQEGPSSGPSQQQQQLSSAAAAAAGGTVGGPQQGTTPLAAAQQLLQQQQQGPGGGPPLSSLPSMEQPGGAAAGGGGGGGVRGDIPHMPQDPLQHLRSLHSLMKLLVNQVRVRGGGVGGRGLYAVQVWVSRGQDMECRSYRAVISSGVAHQVVLLADRYTCFGCFPFLYLLDMLITHYSCPFTPHSALPPPPHTHSCVTCVWRSAPTPRGMRWRATAA